MKLKKILKPALLVQTFLLSASLVVGLNAYFYAPAHATVDFDKEERDFIGQINDYRHKKGKGDLKISADLSKAALAMAQDMADHPDSINHEHKDSQGRLPAERAAIYGYTDGVGENLAAGYETADDVFKAWKGSTEHNDNMLDSDYNVMGIARVTTGNNYKWYWVNMFGDKEHSSDLVDEADYAPMIKVRVVVTGSDGKAIRKPKITILNKNRHKIDGGKGNTNGKRTFTIAPKDEFYVRASATGYAYYTKRVKPGSKDDLTVKLWLEKS